ncbi:alcohol dehydrogenase catalytic domain-containing protein [Bacillus sp. FSL K6-1005]
MRMKEVEAPRIQEARDAIIRITATGICGSDLHLDKTGFRLSLISLRTN